METLFTIFQILNLKFEQRFTSVISVKQPQALRNIGKKWKREKHILINDLTKITKIFLHIMIFKAAIAI